MTTKKEDLIAQVMNSGELMGVASVQFHVRAAEKAHIDARAMKILALLRQRHVMTMTEIIQFSELTPGAVTALVRRLEDRGFVRRVQDVQDGRRASVRFIKEKAQEIDDIYKYLIVDITMLLRSLTVTELHTIMSYQSAMTSIMQKNNLRLNIDKT